MKRLAIIAFLVIVLVACAPVLPQNNQTTNETEEVPVNETEVVEEPVNETEEEEVEELETVDTRDLPTKEVTEGDLVSFPNLKAVDPDGDTIEYTFTAPLDDRGEWQTEVGDAGEHIVIITASDGVNTVTQQVLLIVNSKNKAPEIGLEEPIMAMEGKTLTIDPLVTDADGDEVNVTFTGWMSSNTREVDVKIFRKCS